MLGDLGLYIPLVIALSLTGQIGLGPTLVFSGLSNIITGAHSLCKAKPSSHFTTRPLPASVMVPAPDAKVTWQHVPHQEEGSEEFRAGSDGPRAWYGAGLTFTVPMCVQPMKSISAVALSEGLTNPQVRD